MHTVCKSYDIFEMSNCRPPLNILLAMWCRKSTAEDSTNDYKPDSQNTSVTDQTQWPNEKGHLWHMNVFYIHLTITSLSV